MQEKFLSENIRNRIFVIRGQRVILDVDLARLYNVTTFNLNKAVKRNSKRFPGDFMFQLSEEEWKGLIFHFGISSLHSGGQNWGGRRSLPYAFTEHGVAMISGILHSPKAIQVNIAIIRTFIDLRHMFSANPELAKNVKEHEKSIKGLTSSVRRIIDIIHPLLNKPMQRKRRIGFQTQNVKSIPKSR